MDILHLLMSLGLEALNSPAIIGPIVAYLLTLIPGPFRLIAKGIVNFLLEQAKEKLEAQAKAATKDAVDLAEQLGRDNVQKKELAVAHVQDRTGMDAKEASARVEAAVKQMKDYKAVAEADFAKLVAGKMNSVLSPKPSPTPRNLPSVELD